MKKLILIAKIGLGSLLVSGQTPNIFPLEVKFDQSRIAYEGTEKGLLHLNAGETDEDLTTITLGEHNDIPISIIGVRKDNSIGSSIFFGTTNSFISGITNTAMTINPKGNIGIGISSAESKLHIEGNGGAPSKSNEILTNNSSLMFSSVGGIGTNTKLFAGIGSGEYVWFQSYNSGEEKVKNIVLNGSGGNVAIGTTNAQTKLHIEGNGGPPSKSYETLTNNSSLMFSSIGGIGTYTRLFAGIGSVDYVWFQAYNENGGGVKDIVLNGEGGKVGIGTTSPGFLLTVNGTIGAKEIKVTNEIVANGIFINSQPTADFVFEADYNLRPIEEVESFVNENKHLPEIASAEEMEENGINQAEMNQKLLQKVEELTLYIIEMNKEMKSLKGKVKSLESEL